MRAILHLTTLVAPFTVFALEMALFSSPRFLPWVVVAVGLMISGTTLLLVRHELRQIVAKPLTGAGMVFAGTLLIACTPILGYAQVLSAVGTDTEVSAPSLPWALVAGTVVAACAGIVVTARRVTSLPQVLTPMYLAAGQILFLLVLEGQVFRRVIAVMFAVLLVVAFEDLYLAFHEPKRHQAYAPINIATYMGLVAYFLFAASLSWLMLFFGLPLWLAATVLGGLAALLAYQSLWALQTVEPQGLPYLFVLPLLSVELFWAVSFLPTSIYVNALILSGGYYVASGLMRNQLLGILDRRVGRRYLLIISVCLVIALVTAKWG